MQYLKKEETLINLGLIQREGAPGLIQRGQRVLVLCADGYGLNRRSHQIKNNILAFVVSTNHDVRHNSCWLARQDNV
jgi:hypothetical protein